MQWNARGLIGKWAEAKHLFTCNPYQVICVQETHFIPNDKYTFHIPHFTLYSEFAQQGDRRGGVSIFVSNRVPHRRIPLQSPLQAVACSVRVHNRRMTVCSLYLPPNDAFSFQDLAQLINQLPPPYLLCTDANSKHFLWGSNHCDQRGLIWMDIVNNYDIRILNDGQPTRLDEATGDVSHIDLTLASSDIAHMFDWNTDKDLHCSDHFPIHIRDCRSSSPISLPPIFAGWNVKKADWAMFTQHCDLQFAENLGLENCATMTQTIIDAALNYIPVRNGNSKYQCPWWTNDCREAIRNRRRAQNRMRRDPHSLFLRLEYRKVKAQTRRIIKQAQRSSWRELVSMFHHRTPMNKLWDILRKFSHKTRITKPFPVLVQDDRVIDDPTAVANAFGQFFEDLSSPGNYPQDFLDRERDLLASMPNFASDNQESYNREFTLQELKAAINRSGSTSVGPDRVHYDFFRHMTDTQLYQVLRMYNYIWMNELFPMEWRHSFLIPVLKPGKDANLVASYRPIQLTSCMCKVMERMIGKRLTWCVEHYHLLTKYQCAFRSGKSTADHLVRLDSHVREGFLHHASTLAVFLDIKSAYNMVSPTVLLHRMHNVGFRGHLMHFIQNFLQDRTFQVRCGTLSDIFKQDYGIVQGGVISPMLFNLAIDSLGDVLPPGVSYAIYADDVTIWVQGRRVPHLYRKLQRALNCIGEWASSTGFAFSPAKSSAILFRRSLRRVDTALCPPLCINNNAIPMVEEVKYLGVILDSRLNLHSHVEYVKSRVQQRMSILKCVAGKSYGADRIVLLRMYKAMIRPILDYASFILDGPNNRRVESLETLQNVCLRVVTGALRTSPIRALQVDTDTPPLSVRRKELLLRYFLKVLSDDDHPCHHLSDLTAFEEGYRGLSDRYLRRVSGFPVCLRLQRLLVEFRYELPTDVAKPISRLAPWILPDFPTVMLTNRDKASRTTIDVQTAFQTLISEHPGHRILYTDGSKRHQSVACAFTINNAFFSFKLPDGLSVYTAELAAILEALKFVRTHRIVRSLICTDSQSAVKALSRATMDRHPLVASILELHYQTSTNGLACTLVWIPGHSGITGNVRADYWAGKAHDKPQVTRVAVGHHEYVPAVRRCARAHFAMLWQEFRHTQLKAIKPDIGPWMSSRRDSRREEVVLCRLRLGHTLLTHSYILDRAPPPYCDCCRCIINVEHVLLDCQRYHVKRQPLRQACRDADLPFTVTTLLGDTNPVVLDAVFSFLRECELQDRL